MIPRHARVEVVLSLPDGPIVRPPSPVSSYEFIVTFGAESFSSAVVPSGSGSLVPGEASIVDLQFLAPEAARPHLRSGAGFTFFEQYRSGTGKVIEVYPDA